MEQNEPFSWNPDTYLALMAEEIPDYERLQAEVGDATRGLEPRTILELGCGSGETARRVLALHPSAAYVGIDASAAMLRGAAHALADFDVRLEQRALEAPLPTPPAAAGTPEAPTLGGFDLVISALAVHHLDGPGKAALFHRIRAACAPGGVFVLADLVVPEDPADVVTPIDGVEDVPSSLAEQVRWLEAAGFRAEVPWAYRDLAVICAVRVDRGSVG